jgi:hypothetical protein
MSQSTNSPAPGTPQTADKAKMAVIITTVGAVLTFLVAYFPNNDNVQVWGGLLIGLLTIAANGYGVYQTTNKRI